MSSALSVAQTALVAAESRLATAQTTLTTLTATCADAQRRVAAAQGELNALVALSATLRTAAQRAQIAPRITAARNKLTTEQNGLSQAQRAIPAAQANLTAAQAAVASAKTAVAAATAAATVVAPTAAPQGLVRALCIGINYKQTGYELYGCVNDANNMAAQLRTFFPRAGEIRTLTDDTATKPTKANILAAINWLVSGLVAGQNVVLQFAGHGGRVRDTNGDEATGLDSCIYALGMTAITDDELRAALAARIPAGCKCLVILDSCHSGTAVDLRYRWQAPSATQLTYTEATAYPKTAGSVIFMSGCRDEEYAMDTVAKDDRPCGAMSMALLDTWRTYGAGIKLKYLLWDIRKYLKDNGYSQVPQLETGMFQDMNVVWDLGSA